MNYSALFLALLLLVAFGQAQTSCGNTPSNIETGTFSMYAPGFVTDDRYRSVTVNLGFNAQQSPNSNIQMTASIASSQRNSGNHSDFRVVASQGSTHSQIVIALLINNDNTWNSIKISYLAANRADVWAGSYLVDTFFLKGRDLSSVEFKYGLPGWQRQVNMARISVQLAGVRTSGSGVPSIAITNATVDSNTGIISVNTSINTQVLLEYLYFSYVIWVNTANLIGTTTLGPLPSSYIKFQGLKSINGKTYEHNFITFSSQPIPGTISCVGQKCNQNCISITQCVSLNGIIANQQCFLCGPQQFYQNNQCADIGCPENMTKVGEKCQCKEGFYMVQPKICRPCGVNSFWNGSACTCKEGFYLREAECVTCPSKSTYDPKAKSCVCNQGLVWFQGGCIGCDVNQQWDSTTQSCVCAPDYERLNNLCVKKCGQNRTRNALNACICKQSYVEFEGKCLSCPTDSAYVKDVKKCVCKAGLHYFNHSCISCGALEQWTQAENKCICIANYNRIGEVCGQCGNNTAYHQGQCLCVPGSVRVNTTHCQKCGQNKEVKDGQCVCLPTFQEMFGYCFCPIGSNLIEGRCVCIAGLVNVEGRCVPESTVNQTKPKSTQTPSAAIVTPPPEKPEPVIINPPLQKPEPIVIPPAVQKPQPVIIAPPTIAKPEPVSITCGKNQEVVNGKCVCVPPFNRIDGVCSTCPQKSAYDGATCICIRGLFMIDNVCVTCADNTVYDEIERTCKCAVGFFGKYTDCQTCHNSCQTCSGPRARDCLTCKGKRVINPANGRCVNPNNLAN